MQPFIESFESRLLMSATPLLTTAQKQNLKKIVTELATIYSKSAITTAELQAVATDLSSIKLVAVKPSPTAVKKLVNNTKAAFSDKKITPAEAALLTADTEAVLASAGIPTALAEQTATDVQAIIVSSKVTRAEAVALTTDIGAFLKTFKR